MLAEVKESGIHNKGLFAKTNIQKGTKIIEYRGEKITKEEAVRRMNAPVKEHPGSEGFGAIYIVEYNETHDLDGDIPDNDAKYFNHSCDPNCEMYDEDGKIYFYALKDIKEGEELTFDYDYGCEKDFSEIEDFRCLCGSKNCIGYMVSKDYHEDLKEHLKKNQIKK